MSINLCVFCVFSGKLGALRLKVRLVEDRILPSVYYQPLIHLLLESVISPAEVRCTVGKIGLVCNTAGWLEENLNWFQRHVVMSPRQMEDSSALTMLEEVTTVESRQDVAMTLVKIYLGQGLVVPFLDYLNTREVNQTSKIHGRMNFIEMILPLWPELLRNHLK